MYPGFLHRKAAFQVPPSGPDGNDVIDPDFGQMSPNSR